MTASPPMVYFRSFHQIVVRGLGWGFVGRYLVQWSFRYSRKEDKFYAYPKINERNSAHVIYQDSNRKMWVGGWDCGLFLLNHPKDMANVSYTHYSHRIGDDASLSDNIVYDIVEDVHTHTLWIGTRVGLSIMKQENRYIH